jgi:probable rRNA maturation factor
MIQIDFNVDDKDWKKNFPSFKKYISKTVKETLKLIDYKLPSDVHVSFLLTSNKKIKELNLKFRKKNKYTNVLSFPMQSNYKNSYCLGDIVLSNETLLREAMDQNVAKYDYLCKMTIHGMLHLLDYDHKTDSQFKQMNKYENLIFETVKYKL